VEGLVGIGTPQALVFDTSYFATLSPAAYRYAVPEDWYQNHAVRRYGFHGTSHQYVTHKAIRFINGDETSRIISLHLGGGASATASIGGRAVDTSMGMTPLEGLVMATRSGDLDPAIVLHMTEHAGLEPSEVRNSLNRKSGLLGLCGDQDMRTVLDRRHAGDPAATLAIDIYVRRIIKTIGSYIAILGGLDALVFTAGVGQHSPEIRELVCQSLQHFGIALSEEKNQACCEETTDISASDACVRTLVIDTNEELAIARLVRKTTSA
jgi:acetate kinase